MAPCRSLLAPALLHPQPTPLPTDPCSSPIRPTSSRPLDRLCLLFGWICICAGQPRPASLWPVALRPASLRPAIGSVSASEPVIAGVVAVGECLARRFFVWRSA
ncbi:hypothetical protein BC831DRAFT_315797 [Entophlyctis helioformis]|nr:hypothetical protein BC831DRAFT_315797 [Entophlyctis helioformis]